MARHLKAGIREAERKEGDAKVRDVVEAIIADMEARDDAAVRELSEEFDNWPPPSFRLSQAEIRACLDRTWRQERCLREKRS